MTTEIKKLKAKARFYKQQYENALIIMENLVDENEIRDRRVIALMKKRKLARDKRNIINAVYKKSSNLTAKKNYFRNMLELHPKDEIGVLAKRFLDTPHKQWHMLAQRLESEVLI